MEQRTKTQALITIIRFLAHVNYTPDQLFIQTGEVVRFAEGNRKISRNQLTIVERSMSGKISWKTKKASEKRIYLYVVRQYNLNTYTFVCFYVLTAFWIARVCQALQKMLKTLITTRRKVIFLRIDFIWHGNWNVSKCLFFVCKYNQ